MTTTVIGNGNDRLKMATTVSNGNGCLRKGKLRQLCPETVGAPCLSQEVRVCRLLDRVVCYWGYCVNQFES